MKSGRTPIEALLFLLSLFTGFCAACFAYICYHATELPDSHHDWEDYFWSSVACGAVTLFFWYIAWKCLKARAAGMSIDLQE